MMRRRKPFKVGACSRCDKERSLASHHIIPRWFDPESEETVDVCNSCHGLLEKYFKWFILFGGFKKPKMPHWIDKENQKAYRKATKEERRKYMKKYTRENLIQEPLFGFKIEKGAWHYDILVYNKRTDNVTITRSWLG